MKILITGAKGMLGRTLMARLAGHELAGVDVDDCDITRAADVREMLESHRPDAVIHCAAMTAVDACEQQVEDAWRVNAIGTANVAAAAHAVGARLIAISTDYVFSGELDRPYHEWDPTGPKTVYGATKLAGEHAVREHCPNHIIARIAWLYGPGGPSFVHTMLKLGAAEGEALKVVDDQIGNPTSTLAVAGALAGLLELPACGTVHLTCEGEASWYELAREIFALRGLKRDVRPCTTREFPRPAPRPANSRLENRALRLHGLAAMPAWRDALKQFLTEHPDG